MREMQRRGVDRDDAVQLPQTGWQIEHGCSRTGDKSPPHLFRKLGAQRLLEPGKAFILSQKHDFKTGALNFSDKSGSGLFLASLHSWRNGRRARLRCVWGNPWEFESPRVHWHALEDIHPDSGVLTYYEGGHHVAPDRGFVGSKKMEGYFAEVESACLSHGLPKRKVVAKKGDTIIWHPELPHGGSEIVDKSKSRRSIVYHYKKTGLPIYGAAAFFGDQSRLSQKDNFRYKDIGGRRYVDHGEPKFFLNRKEGNFKEQIAKA
jgi:hypothetical protein